MNSETRFAKELWPFETEDIRSGIEQSNKWPSGQTWEGRLEEVNAIDVARRHGEGVESDWILEIGPGEGYTTQELSELFPERFVLGYEISQDKVRKAQERLGEPREYERLLKQLEEPEADLSKWTEQVDPGHFSSIDYMIENASERGGGLDALDKLGYTEAGITGSRCLVHEWVDDSTSRISSAEDPEEALEEETRKIDNLTNLEIIYGGAGTIEESVPEGKFGMAVLPNSLGTLVGYDVVHQATLEKSRDTETYDAAREFLENEDVEYEPRDAWMYLKDEVGGEVLDMYVQDRLGQLSHAVEENGALIFVDGARYLAAENREDGWYAIEARDSVIERESGGMVKTSTREKREARELYRPWMENMDTNELTQADTEIVQDR